jgi:hypothetical protein
MEESDAKAPSITRKKSLRTCFTLPDSKLAPETLTQEPQPCHRTSRVFSKELDDSPDHEWLQLIQMEKMIEKHKHDLLRTGAPDHWDMDEDCETFWEAEGGPCQRGR